jgi:predicted Zn finger-like uncharacterized protein
MLIQCKSCEKKFIVPDSAIGPKGRLVQCSSCGNKWSQFPTIVNEDKNDQRLEEKEIPKKVLVKKDLKKSKKTKKNKNQINKFSKEYLYKKYNLRINDDIGKSIQKDNSKRDRINFGFYSYLTTFIVLLVAIFGVIHLSKEIIFIYLPVSEQYINYMYEVLEIMKTISNDLINLLVEKLFF